MRRKVNCVCKYFKRISLVSWALNVWILRQSFKKKFCVLKYKSSKSFLKSFLLGKLVKKVSRTDSLWEISCSPAFSCRFTSERFTLWIINWRWAQPQETFSTKDGIFFALQFTSQSGNWRNQKQQNDSAEFILIKATRKTFCWEIYFSMLLCSCSNSTFQPINLKPPKAFSAFTVRNASECDFSL